MCIYRLSWYNSICWFLWNLFRRSWSAPAQWYKENMSSFHLLPAQLVSSLDNSQSWRVAMWLKVQEVNKRSSHSFLFFIKRSSNLLYCIDNICRDTIFNDPRMTLGSHVKGPNNMICREWAWKVGSWAQMSSVIGVSMETLIWAGLAWLAKSSLSVGCGI